MVIVLRKRHLLILFVALLLVSGLFALTTAQIPATMETVAAIRFPTETFIIDAGHGGEDGGAVSISGAAEAQINLAIAKRLDALLGFYGVNTYMTRTEDISLHNTSDETIRQRKTSDLKNRVALVEATEHATLISIHQNSFPVPKYLGAQVFYRDDEASVVLAQDIQCLVQTFLDEENYRAAQKIPESVYLMNHISCRAVLVECGFLSNEKDNQRLQEDAYQQKIAATIAVACLRSQ